MSSFFSNKWGEIQNWLKSNAIDSVKKISKDEKILCTILCVDDDSDFCNYLDKLAASHGIKMDMAFSIEEAKQKIENKKDYKAYIIDGHLPDGSGFELVAWLREKMSLEAPIGFLSRIYQDAVSFRILKDSLKVNYVLEKPIRPAEVNHLLKQLCQIKIVPTLDQPFPDELLDDLKDSYRKSIYDKLERIEKTILEIQKDPATENLHHLKSEVHKIAGSSGSYGYPKVSELCKQLEAELHKQIEYLKKGEPPSEKWLTSLDDFFTQLKMSFQIFHTSEESISNGSLHSKSHPAIYVVDYDREFLDSLKMQNENLIEEMDPKVAFKKLSLHGFLTPFILTRAHFPQHQPTTGYDLIKTYYQNEVEFYPTGAIITDAQNTFEQVEAINRAVFFVFSKPFSIHAISLLLEQRPLRTSSEYKVLVVDDDPDVSQFIEMSLTGMDMRVYIINDLNQIEKSIEDISPQLILLDVDTVNGNYEEVLILLKELKFKGIIYAMVTVSPRENFIERIYESNVDDILFKPLEGPTLKRRLFSLYKKYLKEYSQTDYESLHGLWTPAVFYDQILIDRKNSVLVVVEIENFEIVEKQFGKKVEKEILEVFYDSLQLLLKRYEYASYLGNGRFGLIFNRLNTNYLKLIINKFIEQTEKSIEENLSVEFQIKMKKMLFPLSNSKLTLTELQSFINEELSAGFSTDFQKETENNSQLKNVAIISPNEHDELMVFFKTFGFNIIKRSEEEDTSEIPTLLIIEGPSAIQSGSILLKKISVENQIHMPVLYFPSHNFIENIINLISYPDLNYIKDPFNLMIIIE